MEKKSFKSVKAFGIASLIAFVLAVAGFVFSSLMPTWFYGGEPTFVIVDALLAGFQSFIRFAGRRAIFIFAGAVGLVAGLLAWLVVICVRKQKKQILAFIFSFISSIASTIIVAALMSGFSDSNLLSPVGINNLIFGLGDKSYNLGYSLALGAIIMAFTSILFAVLSGSVGFVKACKRVRVEEKVEEPLTEHVEALPNEEDVPQVVKDKRARDSGDESARRYSDADIERIVNRECEVLYMKLTNKNPEEGIKENDFMIDDKKFETDDDYYSRTISELGMFAKKDKPVEKPVAKPVAKPTPAVRPVVKPAPVTKPVVASESSPKIIRIPFEKRIVSADKVMKDHYNELKSEILAYGVKSRVSNSGDTFRLHAVTYVKVTIAGKSLKLYLALDPKDYQDSTLPIADASNKGIYKEIPLVFKVKSDLSLRRAKALIADAMAKGGLEKGAVEAHDWVKEIAKGNF